MQGLALINLCLTMFIVLVSVLKNFEAIIEMLDSGVLWLFLQLSQLASFAPKMETEDIWRNIFGIKIVPPSSFTYFLSFPTCFGHWRGFLGFSMKQQLTLGFLRPMSKLISFLKTGCFQ